MKNRAAQRFVRRMKLVRVQIEEILDRLDNVIAMYDKVGWIKNDIAWESPGISAHPCADRVVGLCLSGCLRRDYNERNPDSASFGYFPSMNPAHEYLNLFINAEERRRHGASIPDWNDSIEYESLSEEGKAYVVGMVGKARKSLAKELEI